VTGLDLVVIAAGVMLGAGLLSVLAWFFYSTYLDRIERRLDTRKGLYRELVAGLATRDRALLEPTIHQMSTLYDLDALEAVLEEQARTATGRPEWLLAVYDQLGLVDKYIEKLQTARKWRDRAFAAELLGRVGSAKAVPPLLETVRATQTEDSDVREIAFRALARIADPAAVEPLINALADAEPWLAPRIADILARHGEAVVDPLLLLLNQSNRRTARAWAANVLGEVGAQRAYPALVRSLDDPDDEVRAKSVTALGRLGDRRAIAPLLDRLVTDPAPFVRVRIASVLGQFGGPEVVDRLVRSLGDAAWWVRIRGVEALEQIGTVAEAPLLVALNDPDPEIRRRSAVALERLGVPETLLRRIETGEQVEDASQTLTQLAAAGTRELVAELLLHPSSEVRRAIIIAVAQARRSELAPELAQVGSGDPDPSLRALAFDTLRELRVISAVSAAMSAVAGGDVEVRIAALKLIGQVGDRSAADHLRPLTGEADPQIRAAVIEALGKLGERAAQPDFVRLMGDPDPLVRRAAVAGAAAGRLRPLAAAIAERLLDEDESVRQAAASALASLGDQSAVPALLNAFDRAGPELRRELARAIGRLDRAALLDLFNRLIESGAAEGRLALIETITRLSVPGGWQHLTRLAADEHADVRAAAITALARFARSGDPAPEALVHTIGVGLRDPSDTVRARAVDACSRLCLEDHGRTMVAMLGTDPAGTVRERAALAIGLMRVPGGETPLIAACRGAEAVGVRTAAALAAGVYDRNSLVTLILEMQDQHSIRVYLRRQTKQDPWYRLLSRKLPRVSEIELRALAAPSAPDAQASLAGGIQGVLDANDRVRLITGLQSFQGEQSRDALLSLVRSDPSAEVRTSALTAIGALLDPDELLAFGSRALGDPSVMVRRAAVGLFARVPPARAFPRLIQAMQPDEDPGVLATIAGLAEKNFEAFREALVSAPPDSQRAVLVTRLARHIHHTELPGLLTVFSQRSEPEVRDAVAQAWRHRPDAAEPLALEALTMDPVAFVRRTAAGAAAAAERYDLLDRMTQDPDAEVRREVAVALGGAAPIGQEGILVLEHLEADRVMSVRAAAYVGRLLQGVPVPLPPDLDPRAAAEVVRDWADLGNLRSLARAAPAEERRLSAALALALIQDEVAYEVARSDAAPSVRHRVGGALELIMPQAGEELP
jgi:HEAT repeat protein